MFITFLVQYRDLRSQSAGTAKLNDVVTRVNPLQTAIASGSGLGDWPCLSMSRRVTWASDLGCSIGTRVTRVTRVAQSKSANKSVVWLLPLLDVETCQKMNLPCLWWFMSIVCIIGNKMLFTEFKYLHAVNNYGYCNFQKTIPNLWPLHSLLCIIYVHTGSGSLNWNAVGNCLNL